LIYLPSCQVAVYAKTHKAIKKNGNNTISGLMLLLFFGLVCVCLIVVIGLADCLAGWLAKVCRWPSLLAQARQR